MSDPPTTHAPNLRTPASICAACAEKHKGSWPKGHMATWWLGSCDFCCEPGMLACTTDWNFPGIKLGSEAREF